MTITKHAVNSPFVLTPPINEEKSQFALEGSPKGLLEHLGLAVKDLFHMTNLPTGAGNPDYLKSHVNVHKSNAIETNSTVKALLNAGAVFKGKTITDELAYSLHGQNKHFPALTNPAAPEHIPGGSSSGSAVAVSSRLADIGLGTDTGGSIRVPASYQGLWGMRTTHGIIECDNMVALAPSFDTVGWMTRDLATFELVSEVCIPAHTQRDITGEPRFGIAHNLFDSALHKEHCSAWIEENLRPHVNTKDIFSDKFDLAAMNTAATFRVLQGNEIWQQHGQWIEEEKPDIAEDIMSRLLWCKTITAEEVAFAKLQQHNLVTHLEVLFQDIDVLVIPTTPGIAPRCDADSTTLANDRNSLLALTSLTGLAGLPQLHLPLFALNNAPCGLSFVGKKGNDLALLALARRLESH
ncbi:MULTISPECIES: amidase [unclassified Alteromonas]|uniref:amidase n=1 Tax=unclassified Alteromonas TaxID=2614992 RepID=UPI000509AC22|nr:MULTISPECIES: amidase [unclassified Alteromonas]